MWGQPMQLATIPMAAFYILHVELLNSYADARSALAYNTEQVRGDLCMFTSQGTPSRMTVFVSPAWSTYHTVKVTTYSTVARTFGNRKLLLPYRVVSLTPSFHEVLRITILYVYELNWWDSTLCLLLNWFADNGITCANESTRWVPRLREECRQRN